MQGENICETTLSFVQLGISGVYQVHVKIWNYVKHDGTYNITYVGHMFVCVQIWRAT